MGQEMKLLLCIALLLGGCYGSRVSNYKKPDNNIHQENLQEKFEEIDINNDGVIDKSEARKHEEESPGRIDPSTPTSAFLLIMGFMVVACISPMLASYAIGKVRDIRNKKRVQ